MTDYDQSEREYNEFMSKISSEIKNAMLDNLIIIETAPVDAIRESLKLQNLVPGELEAMERLAVEVEAYHVAQVVLEFRNSLKNNKYEK